MPAYQYPRTCVGTLSCLVLRDFPRTASVSHWTVSARHSHRSSAGYCCDRPSRHNIAKDRCWLDAVHHWIVVVDLRRISSHAGIRSACYFAQRLPPSIKAYFSGWDSLLYSTAYGAVHRVVFSAAILWIIFACHMGRARSLNTFLSAKLFKVLAPLGYSVYLVHSPVIFLIFALHGSFVVYSNFSILQFTLVQYLLALWIGKWLKYSFDRS